VGTTAFVTLLIPIVTTQMLLIVRLPVIRTHVRWPETADGFSDRRSAPPLAAAEVGSGGCHPSLYAPKSLTPRIEGALVPGCTALTRILGASRMRSRAAKTVSGCIESLVASRTTSSCGPGGPAAGTEPVIVRRGSWPNLDVTHVRRVRSDPTPCSDVPATHNSECARATLVRYSVFDGDVLRGSNRSVPTGSAVGTMSSVMSTRFTDGTLCGHGGCC